jgi:cell wall-associated NlpC family hydrolase
MRLRLAEPFFSPHMALATLVLSLSLNSGAQAAPTTDDLDTWLADKGMLLQIQQVRQKVGLKASELVVHAIGFLGVPYHRGGNTVETGFDCSGFVKAIYEQTVGLVLPRRAEQQAAATQNIERKELQPGDLVFFNTMRRAFSHVGIYIGDGKFIHSPKPGAEVRVESLAAAYWNRRFDGARRVDAAQDDANLSMSAAQRSMPKP